MSGEADSASPMPAARLATIIDGARADHEPVFFARRGRRIAAVMDAEMKATAAASIPWQEVKADLELHDV